MLIVEDEKEIGEFLKKNFEKEGYAVDYSQNGEEGSFLARTNEYDIIIVDQILPKKTGLEIVKDVRGDLRSVPILMLSVKGDIPHKIQSFTAGVDDYVTKPFSFQELSVRVKAICRRPYNIRSAIYKIDDVTIDSDKQEVTKNGKRLYLTRKEFLLFECLVKEKGKVLSRGAIMENVWNMNVDPFSNTLETHILNLRKKIGKKKGKNLIKTIPGRGYRIDN